MDKVMVIIPSLNPDDALIDVVKNLKEAGINNILVVDDGSDEMHKEPFDYVDNEDCIVITHTVNMGKGQALRTAFEYIKENRSDIESVITVDGDNQHRVSDIINCIMKQKEFKNRIIIGCRDFSESNVPARSKFGNTMTRMVFKFACGINISDTQTGLRSIPSMYLQDMLEIEGDRYEYETNMLLYMKENNIPFEEVKIQTVYIDENSSSHFNPIKDSIRIYKVIIKFFMSSVWASAVDLIMFALLCVLLEGSFDKKVYILLATILARVVSSLCNYVINHKIVFKSKGSIKSTILRYYVLCVLQMLVSYSLVYALSVLIKVNGGALVLLKAIVDVILFFISFRIQRQWVFK